MRTKFVQLCLLTLVALSGTAQASLIYTIGNTDRLGFIDTNNIGLGIQDVGALGTNVSFGGLAYDSNTGTMYLVGGRSNNNVFTVDLITGQATLVGSHGQADLFGAAFDTANNVLYGSQFFANTPLHNLDVNNGASTPIGSIVPPLGGLAYDSLRDELLGTSAGAGDLYLIDRSNGGTTLLDNGSFFNNNGLTYDPGLDRIWGIDFDGLLFQYDPNSGYARTTITSGLDTSYSGLAWVGQVQVPEPGTLALLGIGLAGMGLARRRRKV